MPNSRMPRAERRQQLLDTAVQVFGQAGYHETSMVDVAEAAGVTKPVLYQHFESKRELYVEVLSAIGQRVEKDFTAALDRAESAHQLVQGGFQSFIDFAFDHPTAFRILFGDSSRQDEQFAAEVRRVEESMAQQVAQVISIEGVSVEDKLVLAYGIIGLAEGIGRRYLIPEDPENPADRTHLAELMTNLMWNGLRSPARAPQIL